MATKKYLSYDKLQTYDALIKEEINKKNSDTLLSSQNYTDTKIQNIVNNMGSSGSSSGSSSGFQSGTTVFSADGKNITQTYGTTKLETKFVSNDVIVQELYENDVLIQTKTITFSADGSTITEDVVEASSF